MKKLKVFPALLVCLMVMVLMSCNDRTTVESPPPITGTVTIIGTPQVGQTLRANTNNLGGRGTISYQWMRGWTNIGTNSSTYVVQQADIGSAIRVIVTRSDNPGSITSAPTAVVTPSAFDIETWRFTVSWGGISGTPTFPGPFDHLADTFLTEAEWNTIEPHIILVNSNSNMSWFDIENIGLWSATEREMLRDHLEWDEMATFFWVDINYRYNWLRVIKN